VHPVAADIEAPPCHGIKAAVAGFGDVFVDRSGTRNHKDKCERAEEYAAGPRMSGRGWVGSIVHT
jgi:hypothetical protein